MICNSFENGKVKTENGKVEGLTLNDERLKFLVSGVKFNVISHAEGAEGAEKS